MIARFILCTSPSLSPPVCSFDSVPFLMHDYDLTRTTNIKEVLPSAAGNHTSNFNWTFLSTLNAGKWFLKVGLWLCELV
jgi:hypothetical protein